MQEYQMNILTTSQYIIGLLLKKVKSNNVIKIN